MRSIFEPALERRNPARQGSASWHRGSARFDRRLPTRSTSAPRPIVPQRGHGPSPPRHLSSAMSGSKGQVSASGDRRFRKGTRGAPRICMCDPQVKAPGMCLPSATNRQRADDGSGIGSGRAGDIRISFAASAFLACRHVVPLRRPAVFIAGRSRPCRCSPSCSPPPAEARSCGADNLQLWRVVCCHDLAEPAAEEVEGRQR